VFNASRQRLKHSCFLIEAICNLFSDFLYRIELKDRNTPTTLCDQLVEQWIPSALPSKKVVANEVKYSLPHPEVAKFPPLFAEFEDHIEKKSGIIRSYGVSMTTLEEVCS